jgi:phosphoribulokinase
MFNERLVGLPNLKEIDFNSFKLKIEQIISNERIPGKPFVINISGASAVGKSTISDILSSEIPDCGVLNFDDYLRGWDIGPLNHDSGDPNKPYFARLNPNVYDLKQIYEDVSALKQGKSIQKPTFDEINKTPGDTITFNPPSVLVLDGIYTLESPFVELGDVSILVEARLHDRLIRKIIRNSICYKQNTNEIIQTYLTNDEPTYPFYRDSLRSTARLIVDNPLTPTRDFENFPEQVITMQPHNVKSLYPKFGNGIIMPEEELSIGTINSSDHVLTYRVRNKLLINDLIGNDAYLLLSNYYQIQ